MGALRQATKTCIPSAEPSHLEASRNVSVNAVVENNDNNVSPLVPLVQDGRLRKMLHMIESQPARTIRDLAVECNLSGSRLQHLFKQHTGLGLGKLRTEQRMQQATDFLVYTNMSIKEIASTIGYEHTSSFTRAFERRFRQAPSCYRRARSTYDKPARNR